MTFFMIRENPRSYGGIAYVYVYICRVVQDL